MERVFSEEQCDRRYALRRQERRIHTGQRERERRFLEALRWMGRSGAPWRFLPAEYGRWNSVYKRFARWDDLGVWARLLAGVADAPDLQAVMIDATVIRGIDPLQWLSRPFGAVIPRGGRACGRGRSCRVRTSVAAAFSV